MRARMRPAHHMSNKVKKAADEYVRENQGDIIRRMMKIMVLVLNEQYGFGKVRCNRVLEAINQAAEEQKHDEVFWSHVDQRVHQIGFEFTDEDWRKGFS